MKVVQIRNSRYNTRKDLYQACMICGVLLNSLAASPENMLIVPRYRAVAAQLDDQLADRLVAYLKSRYIDAKAVKARGDEQLLPAYDLEEIAEACERFEKRQAEAAEEDLEEEDDEEEWNFPEIIPEAVKAQEETGYGPDVQVHTRSFKMICSDKTEFNCKLWRYKDTLTRDQTYHIQIEQVRYMISLQGNRRVISLSGLNEGDDETYEIIEAHRAELQANILPNLDQLIPYWL